MLIFCLLDYLAVMVLFAFISNYYSMRLRQLSRMMKAGDNVGRILLVEFRDQDMSVFDEVMGVLKNNMNFEHIKLNEYRRYHFQD